MEGWREIGSGLYSLRRASLRLITIDPQFDLERYHDEDVSTRPAMPDLHHTSLNRTFSGLGGLSSTADDSSGDAPVTGLDWGENKWNPFDDSHAVVLDDGKGLESEDERPYHIFTKRQRWFLVVVIGVAGMFSGLSSNIYFPSLDAIARASHLPHFIRLHPTRLPLTTTW